MSKWIPVETKQCFVGIPLEVVAFRLNVLDLHVDTAMAESKCRYVAIPVDWDIVRVWRHVWIAHNTVESPIDVRWHFAHDNQAAGLALHSAGAIGAREVKGSGPL